MQPMPNISATVKPGTATLQAIRAGFQLSVREYLLVQLAHSRVSRRCETVLVLHIYKRLADWRTRAQLQLFRTNTPYLTTRRRLRKATLDMSCLHQELRLSLIDCRPCHDLNAPHGRPGSPKSMAGPRTCKSAKPSSLHAWCMVDDNRRHR
jgi:hypothetical protein